MERVAGAFGDERREFVAGRDAKVGDGRVIDVVDAAPSGRVAVVPAVTEYPVEAVLEFWTDPGAGVHPVGDRANG